MADPFGDTRTEMMIAQLCSLVYNALSGEDETAKSPQDFIPDYHLTDEAKQKKKAEKMQKKRKMMHLQRELSDLAGD